MKHAVFIEPAGAVLELVLAWKQRVRAEWPGAVYLSHPPHATVWVGTTNDPQRAAAAVGHALKSARRDPVILTGAHVFYDDAMAEGGQTLSFAVERTASLAALQDAAINAIGPYVEVPYPFGGPSWMPHFTIASLPVRREDPAIAAFLAAGVAPLETECRVSWWEIEGDRHGRVSWL